jgi:hypothetical protein
MSNGRTLVGLVRTVHIYLGSLAVGILLFFAATGFLLNHSAWFGLDDARTRTESIQLATGALGGPDKLLVVEELRQRLGPVGGLTAFEVESEELRVTFKRPGSRTEAVVDRKTGQTQVTLEGRGAGGIITDLHKGANAGQWWPYVIDSAAVLLAIAGVSGLVLLIWLPRRRWLVTALAGVGIGVGILVYAILVV